MQLVLDASVAVEASLSAGSGFAIFERHELIAPDLMWWEAGSVLHSYLCRIRSGRPYARRLQASEVRTALRQLEDAPVTPVPVTGDLLRQAWQVADDCGFSRLYDAAYVALARAREATLVTVDAGLARGPASRLIAIVGPTELPPG